MLRAVFGGPLVHGTAVARALRAPNKSSTMLRISFNLLLVFAAIQTVQANPVAPSALIPAEGPYNSFAVLFNPEAVPGVGSAAGADYLLVDGRRLGALVVAETLAGYNSETATASFSEGTIVARSSRVMAGSAFDVLSIVQEDGNEVFAIGFTAFEVAGRMMIDGAAPHTLPTEGSSLHVVAWAETEEAAALLIGLTLEILSQAQPLGFLQEAPPAQTASATLSVYPNPCLLACTMAVELTNPGRASLAVFDMLGRHVADITAADFEPGNHSFAFGANRLPAGVYLARLVVDGRISSTRITVTR